MRAQLAAAEEQLMFPGVIVHRQHRHCPSNPLEAQTSCRSVDRRTVFAFAGEKSPVVSIHNTVELGHKDN